MSPARKTGMDVAGTDGSDAEHRDEGWQAFAEEADEGTLAPNAALEAAMQEAAASVEARQAARGAGEIGEPGALLEELTEARAALAKTQEKYLRMAADFENLRRRSLKEKEEAHTYGHQNVVKDLLASVDNLERAIDHARKGGDEGAEGLLEGVELVFRELQSALAKHGVELIEADGQPFDPALHEAMAQVPDGAVPTNTIVEVFQRGYQLRGRLLRPARVVVSKAPEADEKEQPES